MTETEANVKKFETEFFRDYKVRIELEGKTIDLKRAIEKIISKDIGMINEAMITIDGNIFKDLDDMEREYDAEAFDRLYNLTDEFYDKLEEFENEGKSLYIHTEHNCV